MAKGPKEPVGDLALVLFSLALAFVAWAIVRQQEILTQTILVPIEMRNLPPFVELDPEKPFDPSQIPVSFSFPKGEERMAGAGNFRLTVDLGELAQRVGSTERFTDHPIRVDRTNLTAPGKLNFIEFRADPQIMFRAKLRVARARVQPRLGADAPAPGFSVENDALRAEPEEIDVAVDRFHYELAQREPLTIPTEEISVAGATASIRKVVGLLYDTKDGIYPLPTNATTTVTVFVPIPENEGERRFAEIPIRYEPIRRRIGAILSPESASVTVTGPVSVLDTLTSSSLRLVPRPNEFLDEETPGESFEMLIDASFDRIDSSLVERLHSVVEPRFVRVRFFARENEPSPEALPARTPSTLDAVRRRLTSPNDSNTTGTRPP